MMIKKIIVYTLIVFTAIPALHAAKAQSDDAENYQTWVDSASAAYTNHNYQKSIDFYQQVLDHGLSSADLHYNLANAWYKNGDLPEAILHYEKALKYNPAHEDASVNLQKARSLITDRIEPASVPFYKRWYKSLWQMMPLRSWAFLSIATFLILLAAILIFVFTTSVNIKKVVFPLGLLALVVMSMSLVLGSEAKSYLENTHKAIVLEPSLNVKSAPDDSGTDLFTIHEGLKVEVKQQLGEWAEVEIADGRVGWVPATTYRKI